MVSVARQLGNAVPPLLAGAIAGAVLEHLAEYGLASRQDELLGTAQQLQLVG